MANSSFLDIVVGYDSGDATEGKGKKFASKEITGSAGYNQSRFLRNLSVAFRRIADTLTYTMGRTYGLFLLGFGLLTLLLHFVKDYMNFYVEVPLDILIAGSVFAFISIPFMLVDKPLSIALQEFSVTDFIFFEFFCIQPAERRRESTPSIPPVVGLVLGLMCAVLGAFVPLWYVVLGIISLVYLYLSLISPEFSFFLTFLAMPYLPLIPQYSEIVLSVLVGTTLISFVRKVASGKRVYFFEQYDLALFLMLLLVLISGVFVKGLESFTSSIVMIVLSMGYVLTGSLVTNRRLADGVIKAIIASSVPISVIAIAEFIMTLASSGLAGFGGVHATFDSPDVLAIFLLAAAVCALYFAFARRHRGTKLFYGVIFVLTLVAMGLTLRLWVLVAGLCGIAAYLALQMERGAGIVLAVISLLPYALLLLPGEWLMWLAELPGISMLGFGESAAVWIRSRRMLLDNIFSGVGIGADSFASEYADYSDVTAGNSNCFLLQIACEAGVFALVVFVVIFLIRLKHRSIYVPYVKNSQVSLLTKFSEVAIVVLMVYGLFTSLWSDMTMYYLFWCLFGLGSAVLRVSKQEFDDRVAYFSDGSGVDSSSIDISIK